VAYGRAGLLLAAAATAFLSSAAAAAPPGSVHLDAVHTRHVTWTGQLTGASGAAPLGLGVNGQPEGTCQPPSCALVSLNLGLPRKAGSSPGHLLVTAGTNESNAGLVLRLFDGQGRQLAYADHAGGAIGVSTDPSEPNQFSYLKFDLPRGTFTLWIQNTGGVAPYTADVFWKLKRK
jgi:hypothetical protein